MPGARRWHRYDSGVPWYVAVIVGGSLAVVLAIVIPLSRRVRVETGIDPEVEAQILLGDEPEETYGEQPPKGRRRDYDPGEISALRRIGDPEDEARRKRKIS